jgi:hypothetical protein
VHDIRAEERHELSGELQTTRYAQWGLFEIEAQHGQLDRPFFRGVLEDDKSDRMASSRHSLG